MIDIDAIEQRFRSARHTQQPCITADEVHDLIAEIRRLRGEWKEHRKCKCGETPEYCHDRYDGEMVHWIVCNKCCAQSGFYRCECCAWAAWDGVA